MPSPYGYTMWWPWLRGYHGESVEGYDNQNTYTRYIWVDEDLKTSMGY
jgi:peptide/nickel transport system substrate-binding protein